MAWMRCLRSETPAPPLACWLEEAAGAPRALSIDSNAAEGRGGCHLAKGGSITPFCEEFFIVHFVRITLRGQIADNLDRQGRSWKPFVDGPKKTEGPGSNQTGVTLPETVRRRSLDVTNLVKHAATRPESGWGAAVRVFVACGSVTGHSHLLVATLSATGRG